MTRKELVNALFEAMDKKLKKAECENVVDFIFDTITSSLKDGEEVKIPGFGIFQVVKRAERTCINPANGEKMLVPAKETVKFKISSTLKKELNK